MNTSYKITDRASYDNVFAKIDRLNRIDFKEFPGFRMGSFLAVSYYEAAGGNLQPAWKQTAKNILRCFIRDFSYDFQAIKDDEIMVFYSHEHGRREDYVKLMNDVQAMIPGSYCFTGKDCPRSIVVSKTAWKNLLLLKTWNKQLKEVEPHRDARAFLLSKLALAYRWKLILNANENALKKCRGLITIFDAREYENILTQVCSKLGIRSATIEHGFFPPPYYSGSKDYCLAMPSLGFVSDEFWAWGEAIRENVFAGGLKEEQVIAVGYPKKIEKLSDVEPEQKTIGVILDGGESAFPENEIMARIAVEFAQKYHFDVVLKPHPHDFKDYVKAFNLLEEEHHVRVSREPILQYACNVTFSISFCSTAYLDLMCHGKMVYRYRSSSKQSMYSMMGDEGTFCNVEELERLYSNCNSAVDDQIITRLVGDIDHMAQSYTAHANRLFSEEK